MIHQYPNNILTHEGQTTVLDFGNEINDFKERIRVIDDLIVYAGYHGDENGNWCRDFDDDELRITEAIAASFPNVVLKRVGKPGLSDDEIMAAHKRGNVFFTWCDSENKVKSVMQEA